MRVLLATDHYPPSIGGAQIQSRLLARGLRTRGHDVIVATVWQDGMPAVEDDDGVAVHRLRQLRTLPGLAGAPRKRHQPPFPDPLTTFALRREITRFRPDLVHSYGWVSYSCAVALLGSRTPLVLTARDFAYACANRTLMRDGRECSGPGLAKCLACAGRHYGRARGPLAAFGVLSGRPLLRRKASVVVCVSSYVEDVVRRDFAGSGAASIPTCVIHDAVARTAGPEPHGGDPAVLGRLADLPDEPFLLFVGALRAVKGVGELLAAYAQLDRPPPLVLIGTREPDTPAIPSSVRVLTDVPHETVLAACERCLFGVMPSLFPEPFGTVVCEVMSCGRPVIGTEPGGHNDMIDDRETGLLVPRGDVQALAAAMAELLSDPELRERLGEAARVRAGEFSPAASLSRYERLYAELTVDGEGPFAGRAERAPAAESRRVAG